MDSLTRRRIYYVPFPLSSGVAAQTFISTYRFVSLTSSSRFRGSTPVYTQVPVQPLQREHHPADHKAFPQVPDDCTSWVRVHQLQLMVDQRQVSGTVPSVLMGPQISDAECSNRPPWDGFMRSVVTAWLRWLLTTGSQTHSKPEF